MKRILTIAAILSATLALQACNKGPDPAKVQADVAKAQADGQKKIADAQADLDKVVAKNRKTMADTDADAPGQSRKRGLRRALVNQGHRVVAGRDIGDTERSILARRSVIRRPQHHDHRAH